MKVVSLFSGCGGTDLGFERAGFQLIWANDIDKDACNSYAANFWVPPNTGDVKKVTSFPKSDVLVGCYPCQGFSIYGNRNENDPRNFLYMEFVRALHNIKPRYFVAENVKGLLFGYGSNLLKDMIVRYKKEGYDVTYKLVNAKEYGIPQDRERVFIVGTRTDLHEEYLFPEQTHGPGLKPYATLNSAIGDLPKPKKGEVFEGSFSSHYMSRNRKRGWNEVSFTIQASGRHAPLHPDGGKMVKVGKDAFKFGKAPNRRLSYKECAAIQTFPSWFKFEGDMDSKYMQIGNAVPPLLARRIAESLG